MSTSMRAKFQLSSVTFNGHSETLKFIAVYGGATNKEDNTYSEATPSADLSMCVTNKALHGKFRPGDKFYVDFTPAPAD